MNFVFPREEHIEEIRENAGYQHLLFFHNLFHKVFKSEPNPIFQDSCKLKAFAFNKGNVTKKLKYASRRGRKFCSKEKKPCNIFSFSHKAFFYRITKVRILL